MHRRVLWLVTLAALQVACATTPYSPAVEPEGPYVLELREGEPQIERGEPVPWVDGLGHYFFSLPAKLILFDWRVDNHDISIETEQALRDYLAANGLCNVKVRLNQYAPRGEWQRLFKNQDVPGGWRFTLGLLSVTFYTIFPERLFAGFPFIGGGDHYNPYTNTISLYSDRRPIALHEGGHAKDFALREGRHWKGLYAGSRSIPLAGLLVALWQEAVATNDALGFDAAYGDGADLRRAYRSLYPAYGTYLGGTAQQGASFFTGGWVLYAIQYGTIVAGHAAGQTRALFVPLDPAPASPLDSSLESAPEVERPEWASYRACEPEWPEPGGSERGPEDEMTADPPAAPDPEWGTP